MAFDFFFYFVVNNLKSYLTHSLGRGNHQQQFTAWWKRCNVYFQLCSKIRWGNDHKHCHVLVFYFTCLDITHSWIYFNSGSDFICVLDDLGQDDAPTKTNPSLTEAKDLAVNISDLENILDEEDVGVRHPLLSFSFWHYFDVYWQYKAFDFFVVLLCHRCWKYNKIS